MTVACLRGDLYLLRTKGGFEFYYNPEQTVCLSDLEAELVALTLLQALDKPHDEMRLALLDSAYNRAQAANAARLKSFLEAGGDFSAFLSNTEETHADFEANVKEGETDG